MDVNVDLPPKMSDSVAGILKQENHFFAKTLISSSMDLSCENFSFKFLKFCLTVLMRRNAFFIELDNVFSDMNNRGVFSLP